MHRVLFIGVLIFLKAGLASAEESSPFDSETGYRIGRYRAPVPEVVPGGTRIFAADIKALLTEKHAVLVDTMPAEGGVLDPVTGEWRMTKSRMNIPGSVWLPDIGKGELSAESAVYFKRNLEELTGGDKSRALIFYCRSDCWMSWNAVKRAAGYGYTSLYWFPEGVDGWRDWDGAFAPAIPKPVEARHGTNSSNGINR